MYCAKGNVHAFFCRRSLLKKVLIQWLLFVICQSSKLYSKIEFEPDAYVTKQKNKAVLFLCQLLRYSAQTCALLACFAG